MKLSSFFIALLVVFFAGCSMLEKKALEKALKKIEGIEYGALPPMKAEVATVDRLKSHIVLSAKIDLQEIRKPIQLSSTSDAWLRIGPRAISFSKIKTENNIFRATFSIDADMEVVFGTKPKPFPPFQLSAAYGVPVKPEKKPDLRLPIILEYNSLGEEFKKVLRMGKKWAPLEDEPEYYWMVNAVHIVYPSGENLVVGVTFDVDSPIVNGHFTAYMRGKPVINDEQRIVRIKNPHFILTNYKIYERKVNSDTITNKVKELKEKLVSKLSYSFGGKVDKLVDEVNGKLKRDLGYGVKSQGTFNFKKVDKLMMLPKGIYLDTILEGKFEMTLGM